MRRGTIRLVTCMLLGAVGCGIVENPSPEEAHLIVDGEVGKQVRIIVSTRFVASVNAARQTQVVLIGADTIVTTLPSEPAVVQADPLRIEQIIVNLLRNALDAVRGRDDPEIKILLVEGETILLSIEDNGPGLKEPDKLFEPFYTTKKPGEGLGLGLAISAGFVAELGGRLVARNAPDGGAVFELVLPRSRGQTQAAE